jgi:hypothetical protein
MITMKDPRRIGKAIIFLMAAAPFAGAQTQVDLATQSKRVDFSGAPSTKPAQVGSALPPVCSTGQIFFDSSAPAGQNLYGCTATNIWSALAGTGGGSGSGVGAAAQLSDFMASDTSATVQTLGAGCNSTTPCQLRVGTALFTMSVPVTVTLSGTSTNGTVFWYLSSSQTLTVGHSSAATLSCSSGCTVVTGVTSFPPDSVPLWQTTFTANVWDPINLQAMDKRAIYSRDVIAPGSGVLSASNPSTGVQTLSTDPTQVPRYFTGAGAPSTNCMAGRDFYTDTSGLNLYFCDAANTWKQASGGSNGPSLSGAQVWFPMVSPNPVMNSAARASSTYTASTAYYIQLWTPVPLTVTSVTPAVDTGAAGAFGDIAFFNSSCSKIAGSDATFSMATTGSFPTVTLTSTITIPAGIFYYGWAVTSGSVALDASNAVSGTLGQWYFFAGASQSIGTLLSFTGSNSPTGSGSSFALPSTCGTKTINYTANVPITLVIQ